jgi:SpoVK/Ycf46/Vps4 family AAA+-type ATPase
MFYLYRYVGPPDRVARLQILAANLRNVPCAASVDHGALADATDGCSGAEVVAMCREVRKTSIWS